VILRWSCAGLQTDGAPPVFTTVTVAPRTIHDETDAIRWTVARLNADHERNIAGRIIRDLLTRPPAPQPEVIAELTAVADQLGDLDGEDELLQQALATIRRVVQSLARDAAEAGR
jgi:hypothetical protein